MHLSLTGKLEYPDLGDPGDVVQINPEMAGFTGNNSMDPSDDEEQYIDHKFPY
jgi:hypothetical protein